MALIGVTLAACAAAQEQELDLFGPSRLGTFPDAFPAVQGLGPSEPATGSPIGSAGGFASDASEPLDGAAYPPPAKRCVVLQCETLPIRPAEKFFSTGVILWTAIGLVSGAVVGLKGPWHYGYQPFSFYDESYFQFWTYGAGSDKVSHFVISATVGGLAYDAYRLNGLTEDQAFGLGLATTVIIGALVEIGDGLTPYGFSAQDWTSDALGALAGLVIRRTHTDDLLSLRLGEIPTTIPSEITGGRPLFGLNYSGEIYSGDVKFSGLFRRLGRDPGLGRFFLFSFAYLSKGYGYTPPLDSRYQMVGWEIGLDFPEILKAVGVDDSTWWGDILQRAFSFLHLPYAQVGAYYNLTTGKWYGPGAPYHYLGR